MVRQLFRSGIAGLISAWVAAVPVAQAQQSTPTTPPAATAAAPAASDPWPRRLVSGTNTFLIYQPQLDSWKNNQLEAHAAVSVQAAGSQGPDLRRHLVHGADRGRQGQPPRLPRGPEHHALELPLGPAARRRPGRRRSRSRSRPSAPRRSPSTASRRISASWPAKAEGESRPLEQRAAADHLLQRAGRPRSRRRSHPPFAPQSGTDLQRLINTSSIVLKARLRGALPAPLRRLDGGVLARRGPWKVVGPAFRHGRTTSTRRYKQILAAKNGDPMTGGSASDPNAPKPSLKTKPVPVVYMETQPTELIVVERRAELRLDPGHAASLRHQHDGTRLQGHRQPEHLRPDRRPLVQRARHGGSVDVRARSRALPPDFAKIPDESPMENVKASVPGTTQAQEAVVANSDPPDGDRPAHGADRQADHLRRSARS